MEDFIVGALESALRAGEIVETVHVPAMPTSAHWGHGDQLPQDRRVRACDRRGPVDPSAGTARIVIGVIDAAPIVITGAAGPVRRESIAGDYSIAPTAK